MIEINLLPHREAQRVADVRESVGLLVLGLVVLAGIVAFLDAQIADQLDEAQASVQQLKSDIQRYEPQKVQVSEFRKKKSELQDKLNVIEGLDRARRGPVRLFEELASQTPDRLWLTQLGTESGVLRLQGSSLDNGVVADFLRALSGSPYFVNVDLVKTDGGSHRQDGIELVEFEITAGLVTPDDDETETGAAGA
jgi:type IV pilus assembly protein PilN